MTYTNWEFGSLKKPQRVLDAGLSNSSELQLFLVLKGQESKPEEEVSSLVSPLALQSAANVSYWANPLGSVGGQRVHWHSPRSQPPNAPVTVEEKGVIVHRQMEGYLFAQDFLVVTADLDP